MSDSTERPDPLADLAPQHRAERTRQRMYDSGMGNPWLATLLWTTVGASSLGLILVIAGASAKPTWENPTAGLAASAIGGGLFSLSVIAAAGYFVVRALLWESRGK